MFDHRYYGNIFVYFSVVIYNELVQVPHAVRFCVVRAKVLCMMLDSKKQSNEAFYSDVTTMLEQIFANMMKRVCAFIGVGRQ